MVLAALLRAGHLPLVPMYTDNARYDFVLDLGERFVRVQVKTGRVKEAEGVVCFPTSSSPTHRGRGRQDYRGQADYFAVYRPELDKIYWVPVNDAGRAGCYLRLRPASNGQTQGVRLAAWYERVPT